MHGKAWAIIPATPEHIPAIAAHMRAADRREVWASNRHTPEQALSVSLAWADTAWTALVGGVPALMWGVSRPGSLLCVTGVPWLLATNAIHQVQRVFLRQSRHYVAMMAEGFERLENIVHADNALSIRWLSWCGFIIAKNAPLRRNNEVFYPFHMVCGKGGRTYV